jgi:hypothetical protein
VSEPRPDDEPVVYTMPPSAYRVGAADASPAPAPTTPQGTPASRPSAGSPATPRHPEPAAPWADPRRPRRVWDIVLTSVLLILGALGAGFASVFALFLAMASDGCGATNCDYTQMNVGIWVAMTSPWAAWVIGLAVAIVLIVKRRLAFWVPLVAAALGAAGWVLGAWLVGSGVH